MHIYSYNNLEKNLNIILFQTSLSKRKVYEIFLKLLKEYHHFFPQHLKISMLFLIIFII